MLSERVEVVRLSIEQLRRTIPIKSGFFIGMKKSKNINGFYFGKAEYRIEDGGGNILIIDVNYKENKYRLKVQKANNGNMLTLKKEARLIAKDLLTRKSKVNFAGNN